MRRGTRLGLGAVIMFAVALVGPAKAGHYVPTLQAQSGAPADVTFTKDIAPILQRSCQNCHRPDGVAPMSLVTYEDVRPWARSIKQRTAIGPHRGVMPPWYVEKNVGIQKYKNDPSLSDAEIAKVAKWADSGAPQGNPADMPPPRKFESLDTWTIGQPDLIVKTNEVLVKGNAPDWWGEIESVETGLKEDRYVSDVEIREFNDVPREGNGRATVGGRYVFHHVIWGTDNGGGDGVNAPWPIHEVGRNADHFAPEAGRLLRANAHVVSNSVHLHSNGRDTRAHLEIGFKFHPVGYRPTVRSSQSRSLGNGVDISIRPMEANQQLHAYTVLQENTKVTSFEPHLHAPGSRMCLEAIWGYNIQTLTCAGYDHNWVRGYEYADESAPLLPKGTILHIIGILDTSPSNKNVADGRNWSGGGRRSVSNMFHDTLGTYIELSEEQFEKEMAERVRKLKLTKNDYVIGCPLCMGVPLTEVASTASR